MDPSVFVEDSKQRTLYDYPEHHREDMVEAGKYFQPRVCYLGEKTGEDKFVFEYIEGDKPYKERCRPFR